ncbi:unnamed protein product, partial [Phaeothamnion confervicola]
PRARNGGWHRRPRRRAHRAATPPSSGACGMPPGLSRPPGGWALPAAATCSSWNSRRRRGRWRRQRRHRKRSGSRRHRRTMGASRKRWRFSASRAARRLQPAASAAAVNPRLAEVAGRQDACFSKRKSICFARLIMRVLRNLCFMCQ